MKHLHSLGQIDVSRVVFDLKRNPHLWDQNTKRTEDWRSPHHGLSDIWVRFRDLSEYEGGDWNEFNGPHRSEWQPAAERLPSVKDLAFNLMTMVRGEELGGVLITRIPPGGECKPHIDSTWHAKYYDKYAIQIEAHPNQAFCFEDGGYASAPGEIYWFENNVVHWVKNDSPVDRITLIISIKSDRRIQSCHSQ